MSKYNNNEWLNQKYNSLTVKGFVHKGNTWEWMCECECGSLKTYNPYKVINGHTKTCGCGRVERCHRLIEKHRTKHGGRHERLYGIWRGMKERCLSTTHKDYGNYGGRGITIYEGWTNDYAAFREWALKNGYNDSLSIDRKDNEKGYSPDNCRWVSMKKQNNNRRSNRLITYNGETKSIMELCEEKGMNYQTVYARIVHRGWSVEKAIETPIL